MTAKRQQPRILKYAAQVRSGAEQLSGRLQYVDELSSAQALSAHKDIVNAIERLQIFEKLLAKRL